ncbi:MAG: YidC/Oxa1 family membrane protein insertase [Butyrivibrio sp.]|nr:YidC/Oxa1 family membrane protein insertase [Butyrivibrio sp.]
MLTIIYNLLIKPIELLVMFTYMIMNKLVHNKGIAIIAVSLVIQTLVLPIYKRADAIQDEERQRQKDMEHWVNHIKKTFKGDERYMMLSTYYREQNYKSWYSLRSSASILLQIPFFTAAYNYLSNLKELAGVSFLFIRDLGAPDRTFSIGSFGINVLPILMTVFNIISGIIYTRNLKARDKIQVYGLATAFLVLLYNSPSGLVLYWTMNNFYSLMKNVVLKLIKRPQKPEEALEGNAVIIAEKENKDSFPSFLWSCVFLSLFVGALIPLNVVDSSATEFVNAKHGPIWLVIVNLALYSGVFVVWGSIFYAFAKKKARFIMQVMALCLVGAFIANYMLFGNHFGIMTPLFVYEGRLQFSGAEKIGNIVILVAIAVAAYFVQKKLPKYAKIVVQILSVSTLVMCLVVGRNVAVQVDDYTKNIASSGEGKDVFNVSKNGKNVVVIMMDRAISGYIPYIFDEKPEIAKMYDGFTYYPNTISFGGATNFGAPALFGGYDYSARAINERSELSLREKNNEALLLMPSLFSENGYKVTVTDPPYAGTYRFIVDLSMYDQYENVKALMTQGKYMDGIDPIFADSYQKSQESRAFYYSLMRVIPVFMQKTLYNGGTYYSHMDIGVNLNFLRDYSVLLNMPSLTKVSDSDENNCILMVNGSTHDITTLSVPDYEPAMGTDNRLDEFLDYYENEAFPNGSEGLELKNLTQISHYQSDVASLRALGKWFEYLKANDCWDNTRIIVVADHGYKLGDLEKTKLSDDLNIERYNPLLLVKDFDASGFTTSDEFMTNADVPTMAMEGLIDNPVNPFTGNPVNSDKKKEKQYVTTSKKSVVMDNDGNTFDNSDATWYEVTPGDIFDANNWKKVDD